MTTTSGGAILLEAVVSEHAVVLLSLPLKSCGWDLTDVSSARVTAESTRTPLALRTSCGGVPGPCGGGPRCSSNGLEKLEALHPLVVH